MCVVWPGSINWMTPPQMHINFDVLFNAGALQSITVGAPINQGAGVPGRTALESEHPSQQPWLR